VHAVIEILNWWDLKTTLVKSKLHVHRDFVSISAITEKNAMVERIMLSLNLCRGNIY
jgi:hypothetical protein